MPTSAVHGLSFVPPDVIRAMGKIHDAGFDVWIVGGAVRDHLLGQIPKDWDLATGCTPGDIIQIFPRVIPIGIRHGTVQIHTRKRDIEVTSFEPPGEAGIHKDLERRDFTINAMALSFPAGELIDPGGGLSDLKRRLIRAMGDPLARFSEDPLRIVRAARMMAVYGFTVHPGTMKAMHEGSGSLDGVSGERIRDEVCKILISPRASEAIELLRETGALKIVLPEIVDPAAEGPYRYSLLCILNSPESLRVRLAALFQNAAAPGAGAQTSQTGVTRKQSAAAAALRFKAWNMSNRLIEDVSRLIEHRLPPDAVSWTDSEIRRFIATVRPELIDDFVALARAERLSSGAVETHDIDRLQMRMSEQLRTASALKITELAIGGGDIMEALGLQQGPEIGQILKRLFQLVLEDPALNTREGLIDIVMRQFGNKAG